MDQGPPIVSIDSPNDGILVTAPTQFTGTIDSPITNSWQLQYRRRGTICANSPDDSGWTTFSSGTGNVENDVLGTLDTTLMPNGIYDVRLVFIDELGEHWAVQQTAIVSGQMKVGGFTTTTKDLQVPVNSLPLVISRNYNTLNTDCPGDFGYGWNLNILTATLTDTQPLGDNWQEIIGWSSPECEAWANGTGELPDGEVCSSVYQLTDEASHVITISFPDGRVYHFRPKLVMAGTGKPANQEDAPFSFENQFEMIFEPLGDTVGSLQADGVPSPIWTDLDQLGGLGNFNMYLGNFESDPLGPIFTDATGWTFTDPNLIAYTFDSNGKLLKVTAPGGDSITIQDNGIFSSNGESVAWVRDPDNSNRITQITDPNGQSIDYSYDSNGNLQGVTDRTGNTTTFAYDELHRLTQVLDPRGIAIATNVYDANGRLTSSTDADGNTVTYNHDLGTHTETVSRNGTTATVNYDSVGNITDQIDAAGVHTQYTYYTRPGGAETQWISSQTVWARLPSADGSTLLPAAPLTTYYTYGNDGLLRAVTDPGGRTVTLQYSDDVTPAAGHAVVPHQVIALTDANTLAAAGQNSTPPPTTQFGYYDIPSYQDTANPLFGLTHTITDANGNVTSIIYHGDTHSPASLRRLKEIDRTATSFDLAGNPVTQNLSLRFDYDYYGYTSRITTPNGAVGSFVHDANGNLLAAARSRTLTDETGKPTGAVQSLVTEHAYDNSGHLIKTWNPDNPHTAANDTWTTGGSSGPSSETVYNNLGKPAATYDAAGLATTYQYNNDGFLSLTAYPDGTTEQILYSAAGFKEYVKNRQGIWRRYYYDGVGRQTKVMLLGATRNQTNNAGTQLSATRYDDLGHVWQKTDGDGNTTSYVYDLSGRPTKRINAKGEVSLFGWDANSNLISASDDGDPTRTTTYQYDALNRPTATTYPAASIDVGGTLVQTPTELRYDYDELGRRIAEYDIAPVGTPLAARNARHLQYDLDSRLTGVLDALGQATAYSYDEVGNRLSQTDPAGKTTHYLYDAAGRRTERITPGGSVETRTYTPSGLPDTVSLVDGTNIAFTYDPATSRLIQRVTTTAAQQQSVTFTYDPATGLRTGASDPTGLTAYHYDSEGRLIEKDTPLGGPNGTSLFYQWDEANNVTLIQSSTPGGTNIAYHYDPLNRLDNVTDTAGALMAYAYDTHGNVASATAANGVQQTYNFDNLNRTQSITVSVPTTTGPATLDSFSYTVNSAGQRTSVTEATGRTVAYAYDPLRRLTAETVANDPATGGDSGVNGTISYAYDPAGNRQSRTSTGAIGGAVPSVPQYQYDLDDKLTNETITATPDNSGNTTGSVVLDPDGNIVRKIVGSTVTDYLVAEKNPTGYPQVVEEYTNQQLTAVHEWGRQQIAQHLLQSDGTYDTHYYSFDASGSTRSLTDAAGNATDLYNYDAFGNIVGQYVGAQTTPTQNEYLFSGERLDPNTGTYHLRARFYNPSSGRMESEDPVEGIARNPASLNRYAYVQNDPVNLHDPSGMVGVDLESEMLEVYGIDDVSLDNLQSLDDAQYAALVGNQSMAITVAAYVQTLQSQPTAQKDGTPPQGPQLPSNDTLIPNNLYDIAVKDFAAGKIAGGLLDAVAQVMALTNPTGNSYNTVIGLDGKPMQVATSGVTLGSLLDSLDAANVDFQQDFGTATPAAQFSPTSTPTAEAVSGAPIAPTEFYKPPTQINAPFVDDEQIPPRYLRVALNGRPIPDAPPTADPESDFKAPEAYINAGNLRLHYDVADITVPLPGGQMALTVRRNLEGEDWSDDDQIYPEKLPDRPFGPGWSASISPDICFISRVGAPAPGQPLTPDEIIVRDETGATYQFWRVFNGLKEVFVPRVSSRYDQDTGLLNLVQNADLTSYTFTRPCGTKITYQLLDYSAPGAPVTFLNGTRKLYRYARATTAPTASAQP